MAGRPEGRMNPGDEAPMSAEGVSEDLVRRCRGTGRLDGDRCADCAGTGKIAEGIGGG